MGIQFVEDRDLPKILEWCKSNLKFVTFDEIPKEIKKAISFKNSVQYSIDHKIHETHQSTQLMWNRSEIREVLDEGEDNHNKKIKQWKEDQDSYASEAEWKKSKPKKNAVEIKRFQVFNTVYEGNKVTLTDAINSEFTFSITKKQKDEYFSKNIIKLPYSISCHAAQGSTIDEPLLLHGIHNCVNAVDWIYTAISRVTDFRLIYVLLDDTFEKRLSEIKPSKFEVEARIKQHKSEDVQSNRITRVKLQTTKNYINLEWVQKNWTHTCPHCHNPIDRKNYSIDRLNNACIHTQKNCQIVCKSCNHGSKNRM